MQELIAALRQEASEREESIRKDGTSQPEWQYGVIDGLMLAIRIIKEGQP